MVGDADQAGTQQPGLARELADHAHAAAQGKDHHNIVFADLGRVFAQGLAGAGDDLAGHLQCLQQLPAQIGGKVAVLAIADKEQLARADQGQGDVLQLLCRDLSYGDSQILRGLAQMGGNHICRGPALGRCGSQKQW